MKNRSLMVLIAIMAIIGCLFFVGCDNGDDNDDPFEGLSTGTPSANELTAVGINETQFNAIKDAGGAANFLGWIYNEDILVGFWSERVIDNLNAVANYLDANICPKINENENNGLISVEGFNNEGAYWSVVLNPSAFTEANGVFVRPAGTMQFTIF